MKLIKLIATLIMFTLAACTPNATPAPSFTPTTAPSATAAPTPTAAPPTAMALPASAFDLLAFQEQTGVDLTEDQLATFCILTGDIETCFTVVPTLTLKGEILNGERLFMQDGGQWLELEKQENDGFFTWGFVSIAGGVFEPVLGYSTPTPGIAKVESMTFDLSAGGVSIDVELVKMPEKAKKVLFALQSVEVVQAEEAVSEELRELAARYPLAETWQEAENSPIPWELVKEGIPGKIASLEGEPFPETAYNTGNIYLYDGDGFTHLTWGWGWQPEDIDYRTNPETRPYRWVGFFSTVDGDGHKYLGAVQQWLNPSGKISYLSYIKLRGISDNYWQSMAVGWPIVDIVGTTIENDKDCVGYEELCGIDYDAEKITLLHQWQESGEIPDGLEEMVVTPMVRTTGQYVPIGQ